MELLTDHYAGALDATTVARLRWHLTCCRGCRNYLSQLKATVAIVGRIPIGDIDESPGC